MLNALKRYFGYNGYNSGEQQIREFLTRDFVYPGRVHTPEQALTLSPFYAGLRLYTSTVASLPLVVYQRGEDGGRDRAREHPAFPILHDRPNPAQTRSTFFELLTRHLFLEGDFFALIQRDGTGRLLNLFPIAPSSVQEIVVDEQWNKAYVIHDQHNGTEVYPDTDILHVMMNSKDGVRGCSILRHAAEALGLHKQVQDSASSYYKNAARLSVYVKTVGRPNTESWKEMAKTFKEKYQGIRNTGEVPFLNDAEVVPFPQTNATDSAIIQALGSSVGDVGRWFGVSPLLLGDLSRGTYSNLSADNVAFYQRSLRPLLDRIELEFNNKLFEPDGETYCEFLVDAILRGDPSEQADVMLKYLQGGVMTRQECRTILNMNAVDGLEVPLMPLNQGPAVEAQDAQQPAETQTDNQDGAVQLGDQPGDVAAPTAVEAETGATAVADTAMNGAQVASLMAICDKVAAKEYPPAAALAIIKAAFPLLDSATVEAIISSLANAPAPEPAPTLNPFTPIPKETPNDANP